MEGSLVAVVVLGFGLGLLHALDADHVMAVSTLASARRGWRGSAAFALRWALGHGAVVACLVLGALALDRGLPSAFAAGAELAVGAAMVLLGVYVLGDLWRRRIHLHFHEHDDLPAHAHWHRHRGRPRGEDHQREHRSGHSHTPTLVGALHGAAGSAPLLAVVPVTQSGGLAGAWLWVVAFGLGVLAAMALFGGLLGVAADRLFQSSGDRGLRWLRGGSAAGTVALGLWLVWLSAPGLLA